jgi:hypothetical protein
VYLIRGSYRGKKHLYYVNGQTGKVAEDFPFSYLEYYLNRIAGTLVGGLLVGGIFSILIRCFIRLWEENNDIQPGIPGGIIFLISWLAAFLLLNILETKNNGKESLREAKGTVGEAAVIQNVRNYRVSGSFKIIKD